MDINTTATAVVHHAPSLNESPERESQTPPRIQPSKAIPSSNGVLKRHFVHHAPPIPVVYKECLKNHAASIGGHALDGCGEFLPAATATPADPTSLKCAACGCHRNFHRREPEDFPAVSPVIEYHPHHRHHPLPPPPTEPTHAARESQSPPPISSSYMLLALSGGGGGAAIQNVMNSSGAGNPNSRKRFRTKFSQEQKEKMLELAEKVGWKMQKTTEEMVNGICSDIGVERGVFKVWMHNNKNTFAKRSAINNVSGGGSSGADRNGNSKKEEEENVNNGGHPHLHHHHHLHLFNGKTNESNDNPANASSSSS